MHTFLRTLRRRLGYALGFGRDVRPPRGVGVETAVHARLNLHHVR